MTAKKSPTLAADVEDVDRLAMLLVESKITRESIEVILRERGQILGTLVSRAHYVAALNEFLKRTGLSAEAINPRRSRQKHDVYAQLKAKQDEAQGRWDAIQKGAKP